MKTFDSVIPYLKKSLWKLSIGVLMLILVNAIQLIMPLIIRNTIDGVNINGFSQSDILRASLLIIILSIFTIILRYLWRILIDGNSFFIEFKLRESLYKHLMKLSQNYFNFTKIGDLLALATNDINAVRMLLGVGFIVAVDILLMSISSFIFMIYINIQLTLYTLIPLIVLPFMIYFFGRKIHERFSLVQDSFASLSGMIQESITGIRVIKAFAQEEAELNRMKIYSQDFIDKNINMVKLSSLFRPAFGVIISFSLLVVVVFGGFAVIGGEITIGSYIAFFMYLSMLILPMFEIGWFVDLYQRGAASLDRLNKIWETEPEIADNEDTDYNITEINGDLEVKNLSFGYEYVLQNSSLTLPSEDEQNILKNINFTIKAGETLEIYGKTGVGKSTLVNLLCRIYNPKKEMIYIDGNDINIIPLKLLRSSIVMVPQDIFLFSDTIANNISFSKPEISRESIENIAKISAIYKEIMEFEKGFDTLIGERGVTISGGQKQRIAIARALLAEPKILILDDALSAVDTNTENEILNNIKEHRKNKTNIIITHRNSCFSHADRIKVIKDGIISEDVTHSDLLEEREFCRE
ncbi:MAG: ABC transporter ATP-binding protein/permease [Candidatus Cloacimonetes bacterium]|nr:ABC transporter ATP-binding protein/permease [Candidatus Cloacimonadota bacterium]